MQSVLLLLLLSFCRQLVGRPTTFLFFLLVSSSSVSVGSAQEETSTTMTSAPTDNIISSESFPNACDNITIGEFVFLLVSASDPFDEVSFFGFDDLPGDLTLYLTDNAWDGTSFLNTEGVMQFTTPATGIAAGTPIGLGPSDIAYQYGKEWQSAQGIFALSTSGEQVFLYCLSSDSRARPIAAISYNGPFAPSNLPNYGINESAVPEELVEANATIVLPHEDRWFYAGPKSLEINELKAAIQDTENNWVSSGCSFTGTIGLLSMKTTTTTLAMASVTALFGSLLF